MPTPPRNVRDHVRRSAHPAHATTRSASTPHRRSDSALVLDTRQLERRPGQMRRYHVDAPAPDDLGTVVLAVEAGSPVTIDLRLESVAEGIVATGTASARVHGECVRCLIEIAADQTVDFQELYVYPESDAEEDEALRLDGDDLDLEPAVRDALVLALPFQPCCRPDCPGLCPRCGARLADHPDHHHDDEVDPRWSALGDLDLG